jgi:hypothetical protein
MKMGRGTGPWGRWSVAARALVTYSRGGEMTGRTIKRDVFVEMPTEHFPSSSNESAEGIDAGAMGGGWCYCESTMYVRLYCAASCLVQKLMQMQMQGSKIRCGLCAELASSFLPSSLSLLSPTTRQQYCSLESPLYMSVSFSHTAMQCTLNFSTPALSAHDRSTKELTRPIQAYLHMHSNPPLRQNHLRVVSIHCLH